MVPLLVKPLATVRVAEEKVPSPRTRMVEPTAVVSAPLIAAAPPRVINRPSLVNGAAMVPLVRVRVLVAALVSVPGPLTVLLVNANPVVVLVKLGVRLKVTPLRFRLPAPLIAPLVKARVPPFTVHVRPVWIST